jgi:hypothetical protein
VLLVGSTSNFNLLHIDKQADQSSQMLLEHEEGSIDTSMAGSPSGSFQDSLSATQPHKFQRVGSKTKGRRLFQPNASFESNLNQTAISNASSTVNDIDAVGVSAKKDEATINTKLAMRELSMMFSSPAFGVDDRRQNDHSVDRSFGILGDGPLLDNSICNNGNAESQAPISSCRRMNDRPNPGITIVEGEECEYGSPTKQEPTYQGLGFQIYEDHVEEVTEGSFTLSAKPSPESSFVDKAKSEDASNHGTGDTVSISEAMAVMGDNCFRHHLPEENDEGDTATLSLFNEIFQDDADAAISKKDSTHANPQNVR